MVGDRYLYSTGVESVAEYIGNRNADCRVGKRLDGYGIDCRTRVGIGYRYTVGITFQFVDCCCSFRVAPCVVVVGIGSCTERLAAQWMCCCNTDVACHARLVVSGYRYGKFGTDDDCSAVRRIFTRRYCACGLYSISVSACNWCAALAYRKRMGCIVDCIVEARCCRSSVSPCQGDTCCATAVFEDYRSECLLEAQGLV